MHRLRVLTHISRISVILAIFITLEVAPAHAEGKYEYLKSWGSFGTGKGQFNGAKSIAIDKKGGFVYVLDYYNHRIQKFDFDGKYINKWKIYKFSSCSYIAVGDFGSVYLASKHHMTKYKGQNGSVADQWNWGYSDGNLPDDMPGACGVAVDKDNNVYVSDKGKNRIVKFFIEGNDMFKFEWWGAEGSFNGQFNQPTDISIGKTTVKSDESIFVVDSKNYRIQRFKLDGSFVTTWGNEGMGNGQFEKMGGIAFNRIYGKNHVFVTEDEPSCRVQVFSSSGSFIDKLGSCGKDKYQFIRPSDIAVRNATIDGDQYEVVYVADFDRIKVFRKKYSTQS